VPPSLAELERALASHILTGEGPKLEKWIRVPAGVDAAARLAVYTRAYPVRVTESLRETFPAIANILGEGSFAALAARYLPAIPAELRNLNEIGAAFAGFLRSDRLRHELAFLPDLAELEWAVTRCFHAEPATAFDASISRGWRMEDWERARVEFQPGLALVRSAWPLRELRETRNSERSQIDVDLVGRPDRVLVRRRGFEVAVESVGEIEADSIERLLAGEPLGDVMARMAAAGVGSETAFELFGRWTSLGLVVACRR
jgi:hypothetical protein